MSQVRSKNTKPEWIVRRTLSSLGYRYRLHRKDLPGKPDIVFGNQRKVIFVHGCFWHHHDGCPKAGVPKSNVEFWNDKFEKNIERDARSYRELAGTGWQVLVIWQCETENADDLRRKLVGFLSEDTPAPQG